MGGGGGGLLSGIAVQKNNDFETNHVVFWSFSVIFHVKTAEFLLYQEYLNGTIQPNQQTRFLLETLINSIWLYLAQYTGSWTVPNRSL